MPPEPDRPLLRQALRGTLFVTLIAAVVSGIALAIAGLLVVVMT